MFYLSCDPGKAGSYCWLDMETENIQFINTPGGTTSPGVILDQLKFFVHPQLAKCPDKVFIGIERVHSIHKTSAKANFTFGGNVACAKQLLELLIYPDTKIIHQPTPYMWQKYSGVTELNNKRKEAHDLMDQVMNTVTVFKSKESTAERCKDVFPEHMHIEKLIYGIRGGLQDGKADAAMIAYYLHKKHEAGELEP